MVRIANPAPEGAQYTSLRRAKRHIEQGSGRWVGEFVLEITRTEAQGVDVEMAARHRYRKQVEEFDRENPVDKDISRTRYSKVNWSGSRYRNKPHWQQPTIVLPGVARS